MAKYQRAPTFCDAEQFIDKQNPPRGVKTSEVNTENFYVTTMQNQIVFVDIGEWIVAEPGGHGHYPIANEEFRRIYTKVNL